MQCTVIATQTTQLPIQPKSYLPSSFKIYILEYLLQQLIHKTTRTVHQLMVTLMQQSKENEQPRKTFIKSKTSRSFEFNSRIDMSQGSFQSYEQYQPSFQYESPYRNKEKANKTQYYNPSKVSPKEPSLNLVPNSSQNEYSFYHAPFISPYQKKQKVSYVSVNDNIEHLGKSSIVYNQSKVQKNYACRLIYTVLRYEIHKRQLSFFRKTERYQDIIKQYQLVSSSRRQESEKLRKQHIVMERNVKISVFLEVIYRKILKDSFRCIQRWQVCKSPPESEQEEVDHQYKTGKTESRFVPIESSPEEEQEYTILYLKDETSPTLSPQNSTRSKSFQLNLHPSKPTNKPPPQSLRSQKTDQTLRDA